MNKSTFLIALALAIAAGFLLGRTQGAPPAQPAATNASEQPADTASAPTTPARGFGREHAVAIQNADSPAMPDTDDEQRPPPPRPASPTENRLLGVRGLRVDDQNNVLLNPRFAQIIDSLSREATAETLEKTGQFRARLEANLQGDPRFRMQRIACGAHLCMATATGPVGEDEAFNSMVTAESNGPKWYAIMPGSVEPQGDEATVEYRVVFTIDPKFDAFEVAR